MSSGFAYSTSSQTILSRNKANLRVKTSSGCVNKAFVTPGTPSGDFQTAFSMQAKARGIG